jgi:hypothetical protein
MPVHSVIVINNNGNILFSKYFQSSDNLLFEQEIFRHTSKIWSNKTILLLPQTITTSDYVHVVFQRIGDLILFVAGTDDIDEVICEL